MKKQFLIPITVLIATKNEERNISDCLRSVQFADQILVIDSHSTDRTREISQEAGAEVHEFNYQGGWPKKRNWALETLDLHNEWILILDADERVSPSLRHEIDAAIKATDVDGYYTQWKFIFLNKWMRHSWSHGWMLRLFRKGKAQYEDLGMRTQGGWDAEVHENIVSDGICRRLINPLDHESNQDLSFWIGKQNEFSDWNAARRLTQLKLPLPPISAFFSTDPVKRRKLLKALLIRLPGKPLLMFFFLFVIKKGFLDGIEGYYFCKLRAMHEFNIGVKVFESRKNLRK